MGQVFDVSVIIRVLFFLLLGKKFSISIFDRGIASRGSWRLKTWIIVYSESLFGRPDKFIFYFRFSSSIRGNKSDWYNF